MGGQTDVMKLVAGFHTFENAPYNLHYIPSLAIKLLKKRQQVN